VQDDEARFNLCGLDYLDYWLNCVHAFTASYSHTGASAGATSSAAVVGHLSPAVFVVGTNRASLHDDSDQQLSLVSFHCCDHSARHVGTELTRPQSCGLCHLPVWSVIKFNAAGNIIIVRYKSMKCDVSISQGNVNTLFR